jgi:hypothetical protein
MINLPGQFFERYHMPAQLGARDSESQEHV